MNRINTMSPNNIVRQLMTGKGKRKRNITSKSSSGRSSSTSRSRSPSPHPPSTVTPSLSRRNEHQKQNTTTTTTAKLLPHHHHDDVDDEEMLQQPEPTTTTTTANQEELLHHPRTSSPLIQVLPLPLPLPSTTTSYPLNNNCDQNDALPPSPILPLAAEKISIVESESTSNVLSSTTTNSETEVEAVAYTEGVSDGNDDEDGFDRIVRRQQQQRQPEVQLQLQYEENNNNNNNNNNNSDNNNYNHPPQQQCTSQQQQQPPPQQLCNGSRNRYSRCYLRYKEERRQRENNNDSGVSLFDGDDGTKRLEALVDQRRRRRRRRQQDQRDTNTNNDVIVAANSNPNSNLMITENTTTTTKTTTSSSSEALIQSLLEKIQGNAAVSSSLSSPFDDPTVFPFILFGVCALSRLAEWYDQKNKNDVLLKSPLVHEIVSLMDKRQKETQLDMEHERQKRIVMEQQGIQNQIIMENLTKKYRDLLSEKAKFTDSIDDGYEVSMRLLSRQQQQLDEEETKQQQQQQQQQQQLHEKVDPSSPSSPSPSPSPSPTISLQQQQQQPTYQPQEVTTVTIEATVTSTPKVAESSQNTLQRMQSSTSKNDVVDSNSGSSSNNNNGGCNNIVNSTIHHNHGEIPKATNGKNKNETKKDNNEDITSQDFFIVRRTKQQESQLQQQQQSQRINSNTDTNIETEITDSDRSRMDQQKCSVKTDDIETKKNQNESITSQEYLFAQDLNTKLLQQQRQQQSDTPDIDITDSDRFKADQQKCSVKTNDKQSKATTNDDLLLLNQQQNLYNNNNHKQQRQLPETESDLLVLEEKSNHYQKDKDRGRDNTNKFEEPVLVSKKPTRKRKKEKEVPDMDLNYSYNADDFPNSLPRTVIFRPPSSSILPDDHDRQTLESQQLSPFEEEDEDYDDDDCDDHLMTMNPQPPQTKIVQEKEQRQRHAKEIKMMTKEGDNDNNNYNNDDPVAVAGMLRRDNGSKNNIWTEDTRILPSGRDNSVANPDDVMSAAIALQSAEIEKEHSLNITHDYMIPSKGIHTGTIAETSVSGRGETSIGIRTSASHPIRPYMRNEVVHQTTDDHLSRDTNKKILPAKSTKNDPTDHTLSMHRPIPKRQRVDDMYKSVNEEDKEKGKKYTGYKDTGGEDCRNTQTDASELLLSQSQRIPPQKARRITVSPRTSGEVYRNSQSDASELLLSQSQRIPPQKARRVTVSPRSLPNNKQSHVQYHDSKIDSSIQNEKGDQGVKKKRKSKRSKSPSSKRNAWMVKSSRRSPSYKQQSLVSTSSSTWMSNTPARNFVKNRTSSSIIPERKSAAPPVKKRNPSPIIPGNVAAAARSNLFRSYGKENTNQKADSFRGGRNNGSGSGSSKNATIRMDTKKIDRNDGVGFSASAGHNNNNNYNYNRNSDIVRDKEDDRKTVSSKTSNIIPVPKEKKSVAPPVIEKRRTEVQVKKDSIRNNIDIDSDSDEDDEADDFQYQEVVRGKAAREGLNGYQCKECGDFFDAVFGGEGAKFYNRCDFVSCSRHRARHTPPSTPDGFWNLSFADEQEGRSQREAAERINK